VRLIATLTGSLLIVLAAPRQSPGQIPTQTTNDIWQAPPLKSDLASSLASGTMAPEMPTVGRSPRILMFGMLPGFLSDPIGMSSSDDDNSDSLSGPGDPAGSGMNRMLLSIGNHNPYFDLRRPGDPGGVGYTRLHSQMQLLDLPGTSVSFGIQGWTPAGAESGGVSNGPTTIAPGLGIFQELGNGAALHGYVGQNFRDGTSKDGPLRCGVALHCPIIPWADPDDLGVYVFVQAMGRYDYINDRPWRAVNWEVLPGIHWRLSDNFWLSVGGSRSGLLTWTWQY
jgi:hypothetical protein